MPDTFHETLVITSETENLSRVREFLAALVRRSGLSDRELNKIVLAVDEATANIIRHAYNGQPGREIRFEVGSDGERFEVVIIDKGKGFDPERIRDPNMAEHMRQGKKSGLGVFLMRQIMDEVNYTFREGLPNRLRLVKYLTPKAAE